ncbi:MAG TPA: dienelactone hydrolase family protein [Acidimicrobiales bacterium]|nr:dienelactone hydrolase family protein [Acidimicrobiales bacterium]
MAELDDFECTEFTHDGKTRKVYRKGSGPAVVVIAEMPGITPGVLGFARRVADLGCTAALPHLFGEPGAPATVSGTLASIAPACVSREFLVLATGRTSPVIDWLRALARSLHADCGGPGVGVVGMCFTGGFALAMIADAPVLVPVLSQPSLPFPLGAHRRRDLGLSPSDLEEAKRQCAAKDLRVLGLRFTGDKVSPPERFARLREELGDRFVGVEIDSSPGNPHGNPTSAHSVLTEHLVDKPGHPTREALDQVLGLFREKLLSPAPGA